MNLHVPQTIEAEVEIMVNSRCALHIVSAQRNAPVNGIVQDGLVASYMLTMEWEDKNDPITMVDRDIAMKIYNDAEIPEYRIKDLMLRGKLHYPEYIVNGQFTESIPGALFVSILFPPNFCYTRTTETHPLKPDVIIEDGILTPKSGPLCVKSIGGKNGSIIHFLWKISPEVALYFISELQQLTDRWLPTHGFSMGIRDCFASNEKDVAKILIETRMKVDEVIRKGETGDRLEVEINSELNSAMAVGPKLAKNSMDKGDRNALNIMRNSGAKGSVINLAQIAAFVGQQNIKGKRMPMQLSHNSRCLPSFLPGDLSPEARGFVEHNYLRGLTPQEAFFHAGAGRDGVIATALKTAETGYMQKKIARKVEDFKIWIDGTVRDANGRIISFMYGDDGMDAKKLVSVKGLNVPYFVNPHFLAKQLNSDAKRSGEVTEKDEPRILKKSEIELLMSFIYFSKIKSPVIDIVTENNRKILAKIVADVKLYECKIPDFFVNIKDIYNNSKAPYGLAVGLIAASSLGEPATQMVLNSFDYKDEILVEENGMPLSIEMGKFIDQLMEKYSGGIQVQPDGTEYLQIDNKHQINHLSVDEDGNMMWKKLEAVTRHPPRNKDGTNTLLKVKTWSGRKVHATKAKSFLVRENNKIVGKTGEDLCIGDRLPIYTKFPIQENEVLYELDMEPYFSKNEYIWGTEMDKARKVRDAAIKSGTRSWFPYNNGNIFTIPYKRSDTAGIGLNQVSVKKDIHEIKYKLGSIYPRSCGRVVSIFPEKFALDNLSGFFFGAYLAEGLSTKTYVCISNNDPVFRQKIYDFCDRYTIGHHTVVQENKIQQGWTSTDIRIHSVLLARFMTATCKTGSKEKVVPDWALFANNDFLKGLIDGYFSGDGCVTLEKYVTVASISKKMLVGIQNILARFDIFSKLSKPTKQASNNRGSKNIQQIYNLQIQCENNKRFAKTFSLTIEYKQKRLEEIKTYNYKYTHSKDDIIPGVNIFGFVGEIHRDKLPKNYEIGDVFFDRVISIEEYEPTTQYAYDLTIADTRNLTLYNGLCAADTFHVCGVKSKDASSGVPRYKELNNATKSKDQKKPSCEIWFNDLSIHKNAAIISDLEKEDKVNQTTQNAEKITKLKQETLEYVQSLRNKFEETYVGDFLVDCEMKYLPENVNIHTDASPVGLITYEEYKEDWWVSLSKNMGMIDSDKEPSAWVIVLQFDVEKLYRHRVDLEDIAMAIEEKSGGDFMCIVSPMIIGRIEVYTSLTELKSRACERLSLGDFADSDNPEVETMVTEKNMEYYICRDVAINFVKRTQISGIKGITKIYPREDTATHEYIIDTDGINFLAVLTSPNVDPTRTVCDDMHSIRSVLGIEATRKFLFKEITRVISFDGTYVNPRHTAILVDAMTVNGCLDAASRDGISRDVGPNAKIMFEKNIDNAAVASAFAEKDTMASLSSSVMYGKLGKVGSGVVVIRNKERM